MRYQEISETEILDTQTGLIWKKDPEPGRHTFRQAQTLAKKATKTGMPWRVPTVEELGTLVDRSRSEPASEFPDMPPLWFWSCSPCVGSTRYAWGVDFSKGFVYSGYCKGAYAVRLVRSTLIQGTNHEIPGNI